MKKQTAFFFYLLGLYVVLQFAWWAYHLVELTKELKQDDALISKRIVMVISEGLVFFSILIFGLWRIRRAFQKELQLSRKQTNFLLSVTHELKTPLAANKLYLQTMQKRNLQEEQKHEFLAKAIQENERLENMVDNILNASRIENNVLRPQKTTTNVSELLFQIVERNHKRRQEEFITTEIQPQILFDIDSLFIETILNNLIDNAKKYGFPETKITLYLKRKQGALVFGVVNEGNVIPMASRKEIFEKFFRAQNEETRTQKGTGLGLFIVYELVKLHNGKIEYKEMTPEGSNFEITFYP
jgi:K+-sensing histidine kinase KdpD